MNKIYKTLKNRRTGASTAVSELQAGRTKGSGAKATVVALAVGAALLASGGAQAADDEWWNGWSMDLTPGSDIGTSHLDTGFAFGNTNVEQAAKTYDGTLTVNAAGNAYEFKFGQFGGTNESTVKLNLNDKNSLSLFEQSQGFGQAIYHTEGLTVKSGADFTVETGNNISVSGDYANSRLFEQLLVQDGKEVARGRYVLGDRAHSLVSPGGQLWKGYRNGFKYDSTTIYTAAVLSEVQLLDGNTLTLTVDGEQKFGAHLTGEGSVAYAGKSTDRDANVLTLTKLFLPSEADKLEHLDLANDYTGWTTVENMTLKLERESALGASGILYATNANIVEMQEDALGTLTRLELTDTDITAKSKELVVTNTATLTGKNALKGAETVSVEGHTALNAGASLDIEGAFDTSALDLNSSSLKAASVTVAGATSVEGHSQVTGDLTTASAWLANRSDLTIEGDAAVTGRLTMSGARISAQKLTLGELSISGSNTISTAETGGGVSLGSSLILSNGQALEVMGSGLSTDLNAVVDSGASLSVEGLLSVGKTLTLHYVEGGDNFSAQSLKVGEKLSFVGSASRPDDDYAFATPTSALTEEGTYNVSLKDTNVRYWSELADVGTTTLDQAHLTLEYVKRESLGDYIVMTNTSGTETSNNRLTLVSQQGGFVIDNSFKVMQSAPEDVIELMGEGQVTFASDLETNTDYKGWIRMTGTTLNLNEALKKDYAPHMSLSVGTAGTIVFSGNEAITLTRLGWADPGINQAEGILDLSGFDFSKLDENQAAITVDNLTVNGNGVIKLDQSAVSGLSVSGGTAGETIFDASANIKGAIKVIATKAPTANSGSIAVKVDGTSSSASIVEGYFGANGVYTTDSASAAAKGTWSYGSTFENDGLYVAHTLTGVELLGGKTLSLDVASGETKSLTLSMTGAGNLTKKGAGTLHLSNQENDLSGSVLVQAGTLQADAGALGGIGSGKAGSSSLTVIGSSGTEAKFHLTGGQDGENTQYLKSLQAMGTGIVEIGIVLRSRSSERAAANSISIRTSTGTNMPFLPWATTRSSR